MMNYEVMGMKQIYNIMVGMALMLGATSCEKEILDNGQAAGIALADGQFIVDYSGEVTTRAIKDNAEKGERINSLTYLLYMQQDNDYVLQKRREIPGLNETGTDANGNPTYESWPLTRDNMTWEQREALKDTLIVGSNYRAVFVANADASLWDGTNSPLVGADLPTDGNAAPSYSSAYLQLPEDLAFNDGNMFYLAEEEINGTGKDRNTPYDCSITLKRVVTRTDWWFERLPEFTENPEAPDEWKEDKEVVDYAKSLIQPILSTCWEHIGESIQEETEEFLTAMRDYFQQKGEELWDEQNPDETLTPGSPHPVADPYNGYVDALDGMIDVLPTSNYVSDLMSANNAALSVDLLTALRNLCFQNTTIMNTWKQSWRGENEYARLVYTADTRADRIYLDRTTQHADGSTQDGVEDESPYLAIDCREVYDMDGNTYDGFHFVGLANPEMNQIAKLEFYKNNAATTPYETLEVPDAYDHTGQDINEWYRINYRPLAELVLVEGWTAVFSKVIACDLSTALPFAADGSQEDLKEAMNGALEDTSDSFNDYGSSLEVIRLTIELPDLSMDAVLKGNNSWEICAVN